MDYAEIYAVDFDGTLNLADTYPELGEPNAELIEFLKERRAAGDKIILWTCREGALLKEAVKYCNDYGLFFHAVNDNLPENIEYYGNNCRKVWAHHYIDDRNMTPGIEVAQYLQGEDIKKILGIDFANGPDMTLKAEVKWIERKIEMERLTIPDEKIEGGVRRTVIDVRKVKKNAMTIYWALKKYEDTGLAPEQIRELKERDTAMEINEIHVDEYYCPACGAENNCDQGVVEDNFCPRCGQRLKREE